MFDKQEVTNKYIICARSIVHFHNGDKYFQLPILTFHSACWFFLSSGSN